MHASRPPGVCGLRAWGRGEEQPPDTPRRAWAGRGGAERRATLRALREARAGPAALAPSPAGSMTPRWLAGRGGAG